MKYCRGGLMTANKRIFLNIIATYGRSLYALAIGLFCGRWTLMSLGHVDYGLMGVVGGLIGFVAFFNGLLASAVGRFYAVSVGAAQREGNEREGLENCRKWFNTAVSVHTILPVVLVVIGYPVGVWAVRNFLTIPLDRVEACIWVWRFTCVAGLVGMLNVPFQAMYSAKQEIAELTVYSFVTTTLNAFFLYYMITHPGVWMVKLAAWSMLLSVVPQIIIAVRALYKYEECRFRIAYMFNRAQFRELLTYAYARFIADFSGMISGQARSILVNKYAGPASNAAMSIGGTVSGHAMTLSGSLSGAFWPAIANKAGEGDESSVHTLSMMTCRLSSILILVFAIPLILEIDEVLKLWLVNPPHFAAAICVATLSAKAFEQMTDGYPMAILGLGKGVVTYSHRICMAGFVLIAVCWAMFLLGCGMWSVVCGIVAYSFVMVLVRVYLGRILVHFSFWHWLRHVFLPITVLCGLTFLAGLIPRAFMEASFMRIVVTTIVCESVFLPLIWLVVFDARERENLRTRLQRLIKRK